MRINKSYSKTFSVRKCVNLHGTLKLAFNKKRGIICLNSARPSLKYMSASSNDSFTIISPSVCICSGSKSSQEIKSWNYVGKLKPLRTINQAATCPVD